MSELKIGVIGTGGRGGVARHAHKPDYGSRIVACCDLVDSSLGSAKDRYGSGLYITHDYRDLLDRELDAVFITTPDYLHEEHAIAALEAGMAVYLEKPMAITIEGCDRILNLDHKKQVRLYLGHNMRHMAFVLKLKELIDNGAIGVVKTAWWRHISSPPRENSGLRGFASERVSAGVTVSAG